MHGYLFCCRGVRSSIGRGRYIAREKAEILMSFRPSGVLAVIGGLAWLSKVWLIWMNGGTGTTSGVVGLLFITGAVCIAVAGGLAAWRLAAGISPWRRMVALIAACFALVALVDLPILVGWWILGPVWIAEELGILLTSLLALAAGAFWIIRGPRDRGAVSTTVRG